MPAPPVTPSTEEPILHPHPSPLPPPGPTLPGPAPPGPAPPGPAPPPRLLPKPAKFDRQPPAIAPLKRKRPAVVVACNNCRKQKSKCDGQRPQCLQCQRLEKPCEYAIPEGIHPRNVDKSRIEQLEKLNSSYKGVFNMLRHSSETESAQALSYLRGATSLEDAVVQLENAQLLLAGLSSALPTDPPANNQTTQSGGSEQVWSSSQTVSASLQQRIHQRYESSYNNPALVVKEASEDVPTHRRIKDFFVNAPFTSLPVSRWTTVSSDDSFLNHLLLLFWTWDTDVNRVIDRTALEEDIKSLDHTPVHLHTLSFCSPFLINAILALSCIHTMSEKAFLVKDDPKSRGRAFADEAERLLYSEDGVPSLPELQGLAALITYEGNLGDGSKTMAYINRFYDRHNKIWFDPRQVHHKTLNPEVVMHALSWVQWGFYIWEWRIMPAIGKKKVIKKPDIAKLWQHERLAPLVEQKNRSYLWSPYPVSLQSHPSSKGDIFDAECSLTEIGEDILEFNIASEIDVLPGRSLPQFVALYERLLAWKLSLPAHIQAENANVPEAMLIHIIFDCILIQLLQSISTSSYNSLNILKGIDPRETSYIYANHLMSIVWAFRARYTLHHSYWIIQACATAAFLVVADVETNPLHFETFVRACQALYEMKDTLPLTMDVLLAIQKMIARRKLQLPQMATQHLGIEGYEHGLSFTRLMTVYVPLQEANDNDDTLSKGLKFLHLSDFLTHENIEMSAE